MIEIWSPNVTLEGDAMVMYQQTGKALFKLLKKIKRGDEIFGTFAYLQDIYKENFTLKSADVSNLDFLTDVIKISAQYQILKTEALLNSDDGFEWPSKWNKRYQLDVVKSVKLHTIYSTASIFVQEVKTLTVTAPLKEKLLTL